MQNCLKRPSQAVSGAVNLALINTSPDELAKLAKANQNNQNGASATGCNDQGMGPSVVAPAQPRAAGDGRPSPEKEARHLPAEQPVQPSWEIGFPTASKTAPEAPQNAMKHSVQRARVQEPPPIPGSQAWHRLRIEELDRLRAEWRRGR
jgi:hypothetical protein